MPPVHPALLPGPRVSRDRIMLPRDLRAMLGSALWRRAASAGQFDQIAILIELEVLKDVSAMMRSGGCASDSRCLAERVFGGQ